MVRKIFSILGLVLILIVSIIPIRQALADIAPPHPPVGSDISPGNEITQVRMKSEHVVLFIHSDPDYDWGRADITATFNMFNTGDEDEYLRVRYPLHHNIEQLKDYDNTKDCGVYPGTPVKDLQVWVNDEAVSVDIQYETTIDYEASNREEREIYKDIPCWGHFNVYFPSHKSVKVEVSYHVSGYERGSGGTVFDYLIGTGAGWKDTIGNATIVARFPYPISELNIKDCWPNNCKISGWEVTWEFEDFEPEGTIGLKTIHPSIWDRVILEKKRLEDDPKDGEAWGRLAKAYKDSIKDRKGFLILNTTYDQELFNKSFDAYKKAIAFLPNDPDWHYGFADLVCAYSQQNFDLEDEKTLEFWTVCLTEIKKSLELDPDHQEANNLLDGIEYIQEVYDFSRQLVDLSGSSPDFLLLTPSAEIAKPSITSSPESTSLILAPTPTSNIHLTPTSPPLPSSTSTPYSPEPTQTAPTQVSKIENSDNPKFPLNYVLFLGIGVLFSIFLLYNSVYKKKDK